MKREGRTGVGGERELRSIPVKHFVNPLTSA